MMGTMGCFCLHDIAQSVLAEIHTCILKYEEMVFTRETSLQLAASLCQRYFCK